MVTLDNDRFEIIQEFFRDVNRHDRVNCSKRSELIIEYFGRMLEQENPDSYKLCEKLRSCELEDHYAYEITCAWTNIIKKKLNDGVDYKTVLIWVDHANDELIRNHCSLKEIHAQMKRFVLKYSAHLFGRRLSGLISENTLDRIVPMATMLEENPQLATALLDIVWTNFSQRLEKSILFITKSTSQIFIFVAQSIKVLLQLDKSGALLENFLKLARNYLQTHRKAALGTEILGLILRLSHTNMPVKPRVYFDVPDIDQRNFDSVMFGNIRGSTKTGDIYCILANFLESSEELVLEYKHHLIKKMHGKSSPSNELVREMKIEYDKMRRKFSGDEWKECEVLIHDFESSSMLMSGPMELLRISSVYWPEFEPKSFLLPCNELQTLNRAIIERAAEMDSDKVYELTNSFSRVDLDLQFANATVSVSCDADEASVLMHLSQLKSAYFGELQRVSGFEFDRLKAALCIWVRKGIVLWHDHDRFILVEEYHKQEDLIDCQPHCWRLHTEEEAEQVNDQVTSELTKLIPLICGVLSNLGPMPLGVLHAHLQRVSLGYQSAEYDLYLLLESHVIGGVLYLTAEGFYNVTNKI